MGKDDDSISQKDWLSMLTASGLGFAMPFFVPPGTPLLQQAAVGASFALAPSLAGNVPSIWRRLVRKNSRFTAAFEEAKAGERAAGVEAARSRPSSSEDAAARSSMAVLMERAYQDETVADTTWRIARALADAPSDEASEPLALLLAMYDSRRADSFFRAVVRFLSDAEDTDIADLRALIDWLMKDASEIREHQFDLSDSRVSGRPSSARLIELLPFSGLAHRASGVGAGSNGFSVVIDRTTVKKLGKVFDPIEAHSVERQT